MEAARVGGTVKSLAAGYGTVGKLQQETAGALREASGISEDRVFSYDATLPRRRKPPEDSRVLHFPGCNPPEHPQTFC